VAANKVDILEDSSLLDRLRAHVEGLGLELLEINYQGEWVSVTARKNQ